MPKGLTLKQAGERASLSLEEIAERTKINEKLDALEADRRSRPEVAAIWNAPIMLDTVQPPHHFDDADVLRVEHTHHHADTSEPDEWIRPRKMELAVPTFSIVAIACLMALFYQATHPLKPETVSEAVAFDTPDPEPAPEPQASPNVSGAWSLATEVQSSKFARYAGMQLGFDVELEQDGNRVVGVGRKVKENGVAAAAHTPIEVAGSIEGERMVLDFTERGLRRPTHGRFELMVNREELLQGRFVTTAAQSSGIVMARRR
ncbi:MAG TPA: hypothetical protein VFO48_04870 [Vicinamibacterales bacterium]|nr:hypothetical protein [Vicinamibacterales bacterium]